MDMNDFITHWIYNDDSFFEKKVKTLMTRHNVPNVADIKEDIRQVVAMNLFNFCTKNTTKCEEMTQKEMEGMIVVLILRKGLYSNAKNKNHSISRQILSKANSIYSTHQFDDENIKKMIGSETFEYELEDHNQPQYPELFDVIHQNYSMFTDYEFKQIQKIINGKKIKTDKKLKNKIIEIYNNEKERTINTRTTKK